MARNSTVITCRSSNFIVVETKYIPFLCSSRKKNIIYTPLIHSLTIRSQPQQSSSTVHYDRIKNTFNGNNNNNIQPIEEIRAIHSTTKWKHKNSSQIVRAQVKGNKTYKETQIICIYMKEKKNWTKNNMRKYSDCGSSLRIYSILFTVFELVFCTTVCNLNLIIKLQSKRRFCCCCCVEMWKPKDGKSCARFLLYRQHRGQCSIWSP